MKETDPLKRGMDRRSFLKLSGLLGLGAASAGAISVAAEAVPFNRKMMKVSETRLAMGTFVSMTLLHPSRDQAEEAMGRAFNEINRLERVLSRYDASTPVFALNKEGVLKDVPPEVSEVLRHSLRFNHLTGGNFDVTVKPLIDLFREKVGKKKTFPTDAEIKDLQSLVGSQNIVFNERSISFKKPGMGVTFDGIAKGYIIDRAADVLCSHGIQNFLLNAGGDIRTRGSKADNHPWVIAIQDPRKKQAYPDIVQMRDGCIATSGNYEAYYDEEKIFYHIVDPKTGLSPRLTTSVSVTARTNMEAEALGVSVFVMGSREGTEFINSLPYCQSLVVARDGTILKSKGWKSAAI
jgi:thiamine biosynthesis lipoprotein